MGWIKRVAVVIVLLLTGLTGLAHGTPYGATTLFSIPALHQLQDIRCFEAGGSAGLTSGYGNLAAVVRAISPTAGIFSVSHTGLQPESSLLESEPGTLTTLLDSGEQAPAPFPPAFLLLTSGFPGLGFVTKKAIKRAAERLVSRSYRIAALLPAGASFETLLRCSRK